MDLKGKKVVILGLGKSGLAAADLAAAHGAQVTANDSRPASEFGQETATRLAALGIPIQAGGHPEPLLASADLIIKSPGVPASIPALAAARSAGVQIIGEVEFASMFLRGRVIGITGSNGKTTTTALIGELMRAAGEQVLVGGNIGTPLTSLVDQTGPATWTVAELSSFQLEDAESLRVNIAVITNITPDHLDRHASFADYVAAKQRIFRNQTPDDWAVLNAGDSVVAGMASEGGAIGDSGKARRIYFTSCEDPGAVAGRSGALALGINDGRLAALPRAGTAPVELIKISDFRLVGRHNLENAMAALGAVLAALGPERALADRDKLGALRDALSNFKGVEHRIELVREVDGVTYYNDSKATNVDSTVKALESFSGGVILILGGKDKGSDYTALAPLIRERVKRIVVIGAAADKIASQLEGVRPIRRAGSLVEAVAVCRGFAEPGDVVLLSPACASFDMFDNYEHRGRVFKQTVASLPDTGAGAPVDPGPDVIHERL